MVQSSSAGGSAAKRGDRYETRWTLLRGAYPVLVGDMDSITIEPPGPLGDGIEFRLCGDFGDEVHQAKREHVGTSWTIPTLIRERVLDRLGMHLSDASTRAIFVSGTPARGLQSLARRAASLPDAASWRSDLAVNERSSADELEAEWGTDDDETFGRLQRLTVHLVDEEYLAEDVPMRFSGLLEGDELAAAELLGGFLEDTLHRPIRADEMWTFLRDHGFQRRDGGADPALSERLHELSKSYMEGVTSTRPDRLPFLERPEVGMAVEALTAESPRRAVAIVGPAGTGKSSVVAAVVARLRQQGVVVAALRLDQLDPANSADALGGQAAAGFGASPTKMLKRAAAGASAVLVVDQLDALSAVSGRGDLVIEGVRQTLYQAALLENVRVLVACRAHDLEHDRRLRRLLSAGSDPVSADQEAVRITVGNLTDEQLEQQLLSLGVRPALVHPRLRAVLANMFNLSVLARLVEEAAEEGGTLDLSVVRTGLDLLHMVDRRFATRIRTLTGVTSYGEIVQGLATTMSDSGHLSLPAATTLTSHLAVRDALETEGVLLREAGRLRFFHQAYFEFVFALGHVGAGRRAVDLLVDDMQDVLRRGQVRSILALERESDEDAYVADAAGLLGGPGIRSHIRAAVVDFLGDQEAPEHAEMELLRETANTPDHPIRARAVRSLFRPGPARYLAREGLLDRIAADVQRLLTGAPSDESEPWLSGTAEEQLWLLGNAARNSPESAAAAARRLATNATIARAATRSLLWIVFLSGDGAADEVAWLFVDLADTLRAEVERAGSARLDGPLQAAVSGETSMEGTRALHTLAVRNPRHAVRALDAWLSLGAAATVHGGGAYLFDREGDVMPHTLGGQDTLERIARGAPLELALILAPRLLGIMEAAKRPYGHTPAGETEISLHMDGVWAYGGPYLPGHLSDEVLGSLIKALRASVALDLDATLPIIESLVATDLQTAHATAAAAFAEGPPPLMPFALEWASRPGSRGLGSAGTAGWSWGATLERIVEVGTDDERARATELVLAPYRQLDLDLANSATYTGPKDAQREMARAVEQHFAAGLVMRAWSKIEDDPPEELVRRNGELTAFLGAVPDQPGPMLVPASPPVSLSDEDARTMDDKDWLAVVARSEAGHADPMLDRARISAFEVSQHFRARAKDEPGRFAELVPQLPAEGGGAYAGAIFFGIAQTGQELDATTTASIFAALRDAWSRPDRPLREICLVVQRLSVSSLPDDIIAMATWTATEAPEPESETWQQIAAGGVPYYGGDIVSSGMNSVRGQGVGAISRLLAGPHGAARVALLLPALERVVEDPIEEVPVQVIVALLQLRRHEPAAAAGLLARWLERATDDGLKAPELIRLAYWMPAESKGLAFAVARRMIRAQYGPVRANGGNLAVCLALREQREPDGGTDARLLLADALGDTEARTGVAHALADLRDSAPDDLAEPADLLRVGWSLLVRLLDDPEAEVRSNAGRFAYRIEKELVAYRSLIEAIAALDHFDDLATTIFYSANAYRGELPDQLLVLVEKWLSERGSEAGDRSTAAAGTALHITDLVVDVHAQSKPGGELRGRCLDIFDRLIELGADDVVGTLDAADA